MIQYLVGGLVVILFAVVVLVTSFPSYDPSVMKVRTVHCIENVQYALTYTDRYVALFDENGVVERCEENNIELKFK